MTVRVKIGACCRLLTFLCLVTALPLTGLTTCVAVAQTPVDTVALADSAQLLMRSGMVIYEGSTNQSIEEAFKLWKQAAGLFHVAGQPILEGLTLNLIAQEYEGLVQPDSALVYFGQTLLVLRAVGDQSWEGTALNDMGEVYDYLGQPDSALASFRQAQRVWRSVGDQAGEGTTLRNIGRVYRGLGQPDSAFAYYRRALTILSAAEDQRGQAETLNGIGIVYRSIGQPDSALAYFGQALLIARAAGDSTGVGATLNNIGIFYLDVARPDSALTYLKQVLRLLRAAGDRLRGLVLNNIGRAYVGLGQPDSALAYLDQALQIRREVSDLAGEGVTLTNIGGVYRDLRQLDSSLVYLGKALTIARATRDQAGEGETLNNIGTVYVELGRPDSALTYLKQALPLLRAAEDRVGEGNALSGIGAAYRGLHQTRLRTADLRTAVSYYDSSAAVIAGLRSHAGADPNRLSFAEQNVPLHEEWPLAWLALAPEAGETVVSLAALAASERGRSQALLDLIRVISEEVKPGADLAEEGQLLVDAATADGVSMLSYQVTEDMLLIWTAESSDTVSVARVPISADSLAALVGGARQVLGKVEDLETCQVSARGPPADTDAALAALSAVLLPPEVRSRLPAPGELVIVPSGVLHLVPFAALLFGESGREPLGLRYALRYTPSLATLKEVQQREAHDPSSMTDALIVGDPTMPTIPVCGIPDFRLSQLPEAGEASRALATSLGAEFLTGDDATEGVVRDRIRTAPLVHLATHGYAYANEARARDTWVALAPDSTNDGLLKVGEILDYLELEAELVVLAACETGLGDLKQAEGTVGLQRALLARGARSVLVSLWVVSEEATAKLLEGFYRYWLEEGYSKAEALRRAQAELRADPRFEHPQHWAAFQLVGAG